MGKQAGSAVPRETGHVLSDRLQFAPSLGEPVARLHTLALHEADALQPRSRTASSDGERCPTCGP